MSQYTKLLLLLLLLHPPPGNLDKANYAPLPNGGFQQKMTDNCPVAALADADAADEARPHHVKLKAA